MGPRDRTRRVGRLLLSAVRVDIPDARVAEAVADAASTDLGRVVDLARRHRVAPLLHARLEELSHPPSELLQALAVDRATARARHLHAVRTLRVVDGALAAPYLVVKGPALAAGWYPDPTLRTYGDLDLLVRPRDFAPALTVLTDAGLVELSANWRGFLAHGVAEVPLGHDATCVDLHWDLVALRADRVRVTLETDAMMSRGHEVVLAGTTVRSLDREDTLLHLCVNGGLEGGRRLLRLVDVDRVARDPALDWPEFVRRARQAGAHALALAVLIRASRLLAAPVPSWVPDALRPFPGWFRAVSAGERLTRSDRRLGRGVGPGLLVAAGRATPGATARALTAGLWTAASRRLPGRTLTGAGRGLDWQATSPNPDEARRTYLEWVAAQ